MKRSSHELPNSFVDCPLTVRNTKMTHRSAALNWAFRRLFRRRNLDEAYLPVRSKDARSGFFPEIGRRFRCITDDGVVLTLSVQQQGGKAITTPDGNWILGRYLRKRLGLRSGTFVEYEHLRRYGRYSVRFTKLSELTYRLDFSPEEAIER